MTYALAGAGGEQGPDRSADRRHLVGDYFRLERWEIPSPRPGQPSQFGGRAPVDDHQRGSGGGLVTGGLLTVLDTLGGFMCGLAVQPQWIVTTSMMATLSDLAHQGPLRLHARVLRRGRNAVVAGLEAVDEGAGDRRVATATMTCSVLDPGPMDLEFERPFKSPMAPLDPEARPPEEFFGIEPGVGPVTRLGLGEHLRNPWGILHGGAVAMLADVAACRAVRAAVGGSGTSGARSSRGSSSGDDGATVGPSDPEWDRVASAGTVLHYLRPIRVGPVEARCEVLGARAGRAVVTVAIHDVGAADRLVTVGSVVVLAV